MAFLEHEDRWEQMKDKDCPYGAQDIVREEEFKLVCDCNNLIEVHAKMGPDNNLRKGKATTEWLWFKACAAPPEKKALLRAGQATLGVDACHYWVKLHWLNQEYADMHGIKGTRSC